MVSLPSEPLLTLMGMTKVWKIAQGQGGFYLKAEVPHSQGFRLVAYDHPNMERLRTRRVDPFGGPCPRSFRLWSPSDWALDIPGPSRDWLGRRRPGSEVFSTALALWEEKQKELKRSCEAEILAACGKESSAS